MTLKSERYKVVQMRNSSTGASRAAGSPMKRRFPSGMHFLGSAAGETRRARNSRSRRRKRVSAIETTFKPGWTCTTPRKEEYPERFSHAKFQALAEPSRDSPFY